MEQELIAKIIIKHIGGAATGKQETFVLAPGKALKIGRGAGNDISFDPEKEDTVSREHAIILKDENEADLYYLEDKGSINGTFLNSIQVSSKIGLSCGDQISFGKNGPKIEFDLDPRPSSTLKKTRLVATIDDKKTKIMDAAVEQKETVGKSTMQHIIKQSEKKSRTGILLTATALLILLITGGFVLYKNQKIKEVKEVVRVENAATGLTPTQISKANQDKVVYIEFGWKLTLTKTGEELYQVYYPLQQNGQIRYFGVYQIDENKNVVPYLTTKSDAPKGVLLDLIGSAGSGSGFVVDERGFIATNRHVAANWLSAFTFQEYAFPGILMQKNEAGNIVYNTSQLVQKADVGKWVPGTSPLYKGVNTYLDATFANNSQRTLANTVRISPTHDAAMIKIELPESLPAVTMYDNYKEIQPGDPAIVMGYPGIAPAQLVLKRSQDAFNANPNITTVPVPTISNGNVGRLVRGTEKNEKIDEYKNSLGDYFQLTINSTGAGNSGGPMFDEKGRVVGLYSAGSWEAGTAISFAVPIKYIIELMGRQQVINQ